MPLLGGVQVAEVIRERGVPTRVLVLSAHTDDKYVYGMLQAGAQGYVLKDEPLETVAAAMQAVARGERW